MNNNNIIILGAGPAGLACAMELYKAGVTSTVIEKDQIVGGLAKTLIFKENDYTFRTDIGPHRFFSKNQYLYDFIEDILQEKWILVNRQTRQYIDGKYYIYPIKPFEAFRNIGLIKSTIMLFSYFKSFLLFKILNKKINNFEDYVIANFGKKLGEFNMLNYTKKIWGIDCNKIHSDWAKQRIKGLNFTNALLSSLKKNNKGPKTLINNFYYPQFGSGLIYSTIAEKIKDRGSQVKTNAFPQKITIKNDSIIKIEVSYDNEKLYYSPEYLVSTIPISHLLKIISPSPPNSVIKASNKLKWRDQVYLFITINKKSITKDNWIYFPESKIPIGRISEMKNFSENMSPKDKTSILIEFFVNKGDAIWNMENELLFKLAMKYMIKFNYFQIDDVRKYYVFKKQNVYPIYDLNYTENISIIKKYLDKITNLHYIGRGGRFTYTNQDHSLEMGLLSAKGILNNKKYDFDKIVSSDKYFEDGFISK